MDNDDEPPKRAPKLHHDGSFRKYMQLKNHKLQEQFAQQRQVTGQLSNQHPSLFAGVCIHVNGYTTPSHQELKQLMALYGGRFELYYHRSVVTHIIATHLPDAKVKQFQRERDPVPIVRPEWIVQSINQQRLLPWQDFQLTQLIHAPGQTTLRGFTAQTTTQHASNTIVQDAHACTATTHASTTQHAATPHSAQPPTIAAHEGTNTTTSPVVHAAIATAAAAAGRVVAQEPTPPKKTTQHILINQPTPKTNTPTTHALTTHALTTHTENNVPLQERLQRAHAIAAQARAACDVLRGRPSTTADDPNFMETFFKSSRLHFIGTWQTRIEEYTRQLSAHAPQPYPGSNQHTYKKPRSIIHIDMDCFFASIAALTDPCMQGLPLLVSHSSSTQGTGEVSAANYEARAFGIRAGMSIASAKRACPHVIVMPYEFEKYAAVCKEVFTILYKYTALVQPMSCDEAYMDVTGLGDPMTIAQAVRTDIHTTTGCTASAGIGPNMLLAKLATTRAKPNGMYCLTPDDVLPLFSTMPVKDLPGVGWSLHARLHTMGLRTVADVRQHTKASLQRALGDKTGAGLWAHAHGHDARLVALPKPRKSVGAEVNWGIRFSSVQDGVAFVTELAGEVAQRMAMAQVRCKTVTLKIKRRKEGAPSPMKFLGHGPCDNLSRSETVPSFISSKEDIARIARELLVAVHVPPAEIRGVGISVTRLDTDPNSHAARVSTAAPAKLQAPRVPSRYNPKDYAWWFSKRGDDAASVEHDAEDDTPPQEVVEGIGHDADDAADDDHEGNDKQQAEAHVVALDDDDGDAMTEEMHDAMLMNEQQQEQASIQPPSSHCITLSQVHPDTLAELPPELQKQVLWDLRQEALHNLRHAVGKTTPQRGGGASGQQQQQGGMKRTRPGGLQAYFPLRMSPDGDNSLSRPSTSAAPPKEYPTRKAPPRAPAKLSTHTRRGVAKKSSQRRLDYMKHSSKQHDFTITMSQIDPATFAELPVSEQQWILAGSAHGDLVKRLLGGTTQREGGTDLPQQVVGNNQRQQQQRCDSLPYALAEAIVQPRCLSPTHAAEHTAALADDITCALDGCRQPFVVRALELVVGRLSAANGENDPVDTQLLQQQYVHVATTILHHVAATTATNGWQDVVALIHSVQRLRREYCSFQTAGGMLIEALQQVFASVSGGGRVH